MQNPIHLIPRNNWDYGVNALFGALAGLSKDISQASALQHAFHRTPVWTNAGRTSLYAILKALELPPGAEVGVPLFCCSVVFDAICQAGLQPRFLDAELDDCTLSVEDLRRKRGSLAAVVPVHMFGKPCDMDAINAAADGLPVIEDCAQSIFSTYHGKLTGLLSTAAFFSFRCGKYISAGEGSAILCREPGLQNKVEQIVDSFPVWSRGKMLISALSTFVKATLYNRPWYGLIGHPVGMRLDKKLNLTAKDGFAPAKIAPTYLAVINQRVARFPEKIKIQREHARMLLRAIKPGNFCLPSEEDARQGNWFQFALRFQNDNQRNAMAAALFERGIDTAKYLDSAAQVGRARYGYTGDCPNAELLSKTILLIPIHYTLRARDMEHIARSINEVSQSQRN